MQESFDALLKRRIRETAQRSTIGAINAAKLRNAQSVTLKRAKQAAFRAKIKADPEKLKNYRQRMRLAGVKYREKLFADPVRHEAKKAKQRSYYWKRKADPEFCKRQSDYYKSNYMANREARLAKMREYRRTHTEEIKAMKRKEYAKDPQRFLKKSREWAIANKEHVKNYQREWYRKRCNWYEKHPGAFVGESAKHYAKRMKEKADDDKS